MVDVSMEPEEGKLLEGSRSSGLVHNSPLARCTDRIRALLREAPEPKIDAAAATWCRDRTKAYTRHEVVYDFLGSNDWRSGSFPRNQRPKARSKKNKKKHAKYRRPEEGFQVTKEGWISCNCKKPNGEESIRLEGKKRSQGTCARKKAPNNKQL
jgi:hypothetical protein